MRKIILTALLAFMAWGILAQTPVPAGPVSGTWTESGSPYIVNGDIYVPDGLRLIIEQGVEVRFNGWYQLIVNGALDADGVQSDSVVFTAVNPGDPWHGIRFMNSTSNSSLDYCRIEYGMTHSHPDSMPNNCGGGVLCYQSTGDIMIRNCLIQNNTACFGGGISVWNTSPVIENCRIVNNQATGAGAGIDHFENAHSQIINTTISYNESISSGGGVQLYDYCNASITGCTITYNISGGWGGGIRIYSSEVNLKNTLIAHNEAVQGAGMHIAASVGSYRNNTIAYNSAPTGSGGGLYFKNFTSPELVNCLIYDNNAMAVANGDQVYIEDGTSDPDFIYCDMQDSINAIKGPGSGNYYSGLFTGTIDVNPLFIDPMNDDFTLSWSDFPVVNITRSPCIDSGCPLDPLDPDGTCCDIGAYYFDQMPETPEALDETDLTEISFVANWAQAYGALGYYLWVATDEQFVNPLEGYGPKQIEDIITSDTVMVQGPAFYYYRVSAFNSTCTTPYSATIEVDFWTTVPEPDHSKFKMYSYHDNIVIYVTEDMFGSGTVELYNLPGQLVGHQQISAGYNRISVNGSSQVVIVRIKWQGMAYQRKLAFY